MAQPAKPGERSSAVAPVAPGATAEAAPVESIGPRDDSAGPPTGAAILRIPIEVDVSVPVRNFRVRNLLALERGNVVESLWRQGEDLPLAAPGAQLAWSEFEVIDQKLAVRITRLV